MVTSLAMPAFDDGLLPEERGFVLGTALTGGSVVAGRVSDDDGRCAAALAALDGLTREARAAALAGLAATVVAPVPRLSDMHQSWIERVLDDEPSELVVALAVGLPPVVAEAARAVLHQRGEDPDAVGILPVADDVLLDLQRAAFAELSSLCEEASGPRAARLCGLAPAALIGELASRGARILGRSMHGAPAEIIARAMTSVGVAYAETLSQGANAPMDGETRDAARAAVTAAAAQPDATSASMHLRLAAIAVPETRAWLEEEGARSVRRVAGRLPWSIGHRLFD